MNTFFETLTLSFTPQIISAILGGLLGAMISSDRKRYGWQLSFMFCIAAVAFAAAMGEYLHIGRGITSIFWIFVLNVPLGMIVGSTLDVLRIASPPLIEKLVRGIGNRGVNIIVESVLGKLARWFGVDVEYYDKGNFDRSLDSEVIIKSSSPQNKSVIDKPNSKEEGVEDYDVKGDFDSYKDL